MKRVFKFKKGDYFDGDEDAIYHIFDALCGDNDKVKKDMKITIISEEIKKIKKFRKHRLSEGDRK